MRRWGTSAALASTALMGGVTGAPAFAQNAPRDDEVREAVAQMLSDAESRSSLLANSGHDGAFAIQDANGNFRLELTGYLQFRYVATFRDSTPGDQGDFHGGFQSRRSRLTFQGHVFDPSLEFKVTHSFDRSGGASSLSDGFVKKSWANGWSLRAGQFKLPFLFEELTSARRQLTVERSVTNDVFSLKRSKGVEIGYEVDRFRAWAAYSNGGRSDELDLGDNQTDWALTGRFEWLPVGSYAPLQFGGASASAPLSALLGAAIHAEDNDHDDQLGGTIVSWTVDSAIRSDNWSLGGAIIGRTDSAGNAGSIAHDWGALVQGSVLLGKVEPFIRYDVVIPDRDRTGNDNFNTITLGVNCFIHGHAMKLTLDAQWSLDDPSRTEIVDPSTATALRVAESDHQVAIRAQVQVVF